MRITSRNNYLETRRFAVQRINRLPVKPLQRRKYETQSTAHMKKSKTRFIKQPPKEMIALLIAAHNEELVLGSTIRSAIFAGMNPKHIFVVDDNSSDKTTNVAKELLAAENVIKVKRSGKGLALTKAARKFKLTKRYRWIHIADADGAFATNYFHVFRSELKEDFAAATGYVRSLPGKRVSEYRVFEYTMGMEIHRRMQTLLNVVPVIPGPTSCFRADVFDKVNFDNQSLTEDFDVTLQIHRKKLGKIQYIPKAVAYTQDPLTIKDFKKQISRWNRGALQTMLQHKVGRHLTPIDAYLSYQVLQNLFFFVIYCLWVPYLTISRNTFGVIATAFVVDVLITFVITVLTAIKSKRPDVVSAFPQVYILRWVSLYVFLKSFVEVIVLRKYRSGVSQWENNASRRYVMEVV